MDLIDTHQHLILRQQLGYGWTKAIPALASGDFNLDHYAALTRGRGVARTIFMECGVDDRDYQAEAQLIAGLVGQQGLVGQIASCRPEVDQGFDQWLEECAGLHVVGFRRILHVVPDDMSQSAGFRANLRKIGAMGLPFDMCFLGRQLAIAGDLARACDSQVLVLDHCGTPDIAGGDFAAWARGISDLARYPHVMAKLSGITAYCAPGTASLAQVQPWAEHVLDAFGPARILWGSDWPVVNLGVGLPDWIEMSRRLIAPLSASEQLAISSANARRIYLRDG